MTNVNINDFGDLSDVNNVKSVLDQISATTKEGEKLNNMDAIKKQHELTMSFLKAFDKKLLMDNGVY